jgi:hypothetical protein
MTTHNTIPTKSATAYFLCGLLCIICGLPLMVADSASAAELQRLEISSLEQFYREYLEPAMPKRNSGGYVRPNADDCRALTTLFQSLPSTTPGWNDDALHAKADAAGYRLIRLMTLRKTYLAAVETAVLTRSGTPNGWGTVVFNTESESRQLVEAPYPLNNRLTGVIGARLFEELNAGWLLIAGSHRYAGKNRGNLAPWSDVGVHAASPFHIAHQVLAAGRPAIQVRGWTRGKGRSWQQIPALVLTPGRDGREGLDRVALEVDRNGTTAGLFSGTGLGASTLSGRGNLQGVFAAHALFVFLYMESSLRDQLTQRKGRTSLTALARGLSEWSRDAAGSSFAALPEAPVPETLVSETPAPAPVRENSESVTAEIVWEPLPAAPKAAVPLTTVQPERESSDITPPVALPVERTSSAATVDVRDVEWMMALCGAIVVILLAAAITMGWLWLRSERMRRLVTRRMMRTERDLQEHQQQVEQLTEERDELAGAQEELRYDVTRLEREISRERELKEQFLTAYNKLVKTANDMETRLRETQPRRQMTIPCVTPLTAISPETIHSRTESVVSLAVDPGDQTHRKKNQIDKLLHLLQLESFHEKLAGIMYAAVIRSADAVSPIAVIARTSGDNRLKSAALWALGELQAMTERDLLLAAAQHTEATVSQVAVDALAKLGLNAPAGMTPSGNVTPDRWFSPQSIFQGTPFRSRAEFLMMHLADEDAILRSLTLHALADIGIQTHLGLFLEALQDQSPEVRFEAVALLGDMPIENNSALLMDIDVRNRVAAALLRCQQEETSPQVRRAAAMALQRLQA